MSDVRISTELVETLAAIARWYPGTADPPRTTVSQTQIAYGSKPPLQSDVLSLRRQTTETLMSLALVVAVEKKLRPTMPCRRPVRSQVVVFGPEPRDGWPVTPWRCGCGIAPGRDLVERRTHQLGADVPALTSFLSMHAEWLAGHDGAATATELGSLAQQLEQVVRQTRPAKVKLGPCPETDCAGTLTATVRRGDDYLPSAVRCDIAPRDHVWEPHDWPALGRRVPLAPVDVAPLRPAAGDAPLPREYGAGGIGPSPDVQVGIPGRRWRRRASGE